MAATSSMQYSGTIYLDSLYTVNIKSLDSILLNDDSTLPPDGHGFFIDCTVKDNIRNYYSAPEDGNWIYHNGSYGSAHTNSQFCAHRHELLARLPAHLHISCMLAEAQVPWDARLSLILKIHREIVSIADNPANAACRIIPILVEITTWKCQKLSESFHLFSEEAEELVDETTAAMYSLSMDENEPKAMPLASSAIELLPKLNLDAVKDEERVCTVCYEDFFEGVEVISMPCKHVFHGKCIRKWLQISNLCPLCRFEMHVDPSE